MDKRLVGRTALVTGASRGIGLDLARLLAADGCTVVLVSRQQTALDSVATSLQERFGVRSEAISADLADPETPQRLVTELRRLGLSIDILVNNAGYGAFGKFLDVDGTAQTDMVQVNLIAPIALAHLLMPHMVQRGWGKVLNVASTAAFQPGPLMAVYYAGKAAVLHFSEALAEEYQGSGVTVTALCPGPTATGFQKSAKMQRSGLLKRASLMSSADVARAGYDGMLKGRVIVVPGLLNNLLVLGGRLVPRVIVRKVAYWLQTPS